MPMTAKEKRDARDNRLRDEGARAARAEAIGKVNETAALNPGAVASAAGEIKMPAVAGAKVIVACKLGVSNFDMQLCRIEDKFEQNMQGGRTVKEAIRIGEVVRVRGTAYPRGTPPKGFPAAPQIVHGAALTFGVDKDWWDEWAKQNRLNPIFANRMVFAAESLDAVTGMAQDYAAEQSGLEPVTPGKDPRIPKSTRRGTGELPEVGDIEAGQKS